MIKVRAYGTSTFVGDPVDFDTGTINSGTVTYGPAEGGLAPGEPVFSGIDADGDGINDAQFPVLMGDSGIACTDFAANLKGETTADQTFALGDIFGTNCNAQCH